MYGKITITLTRRWDFSVYVFLISYVAEFIHKRIKDKIINEHKDFFYLTFRYIDDVLSIIQTLLTGVY